MEEQLSDNRINNNSDDNYYVDSSKKASDIFIGIGLGILYCILSGILLGSVNSISLLWILIPLYIAGILYFFFIRRYYLSIGLILLITTPLVIFGGCLLLIR
jgi:hypothetical protein